MICLLSFGRVQLPGTGTAGDQRLCVQCPDNNFVPLANTDGYLCMELIRIKRASHVNQTGSLYEIRRGFFVCFAHSALLTVSTHSFYFKSKPK